MLKFSSALAFNSKADAADLKPLKGGLQSLRFNLSGYLCGTGITSYACPQDWVENLVGTLPVIRVDPLQIVHFIPRTEFFRPLRRRRRFFVNGDWDRDLPSFSFHQTYRIMRELLADPARDRLGDSPAFKRIRMLINSGRPVSSRGRVLSTDAEIIDYLNRCLDLRDSLMQYGFRHTGDPEDREIGLAVGADGQLHHFSHGKHRLAQAQLLGLGSVEARIRIVHPQWYIEHPHWRSMHRKDFLRMNAGEALRRVLNDLSSTGDLEEHPGEAA